MSIILSSIKRCLRDKSVFISCVFLVMILPYIFSIIFNFEGGNESLKIGIVADKNSETTKAYVKVLENFDKENKKLSLDVDIYEERQFNNEEENRKNDLYVIIDEENKKITFEGSNTLNVSENHIEILTEDFFNSMSIYEAIAKEGKTPKESNGVVKVTEYKDDSTNNETKDYAKYFSIVMLQMAILALSICSFKNTFYLKEKLGLRVKSSPIKIFKLVFLELVGSFVVILGLGIIMLIAVGILYGVKISTQNILPVLALMSILSILAVSIGIFATAVCKKRTDGENVTSILVTIMVLASGELMPDMNGFVEELSLLKLNPFVWISREFNSLVISNNFENLYTTLGIGLLASMIIIVISVLILKRKVVR
ncbi:ABC transporter permease [Romboutsia sp.]|uniref:ABC transporter permease n=1 Tax=Romboutsia sp. TaxID=1965302 RepID=UPI003F2CE8B7